MNIRMHLDIMADDKQEAGDLMAKLAAAFGGQVQVTAGTTAPAKGETPEKVTSDDDTDGLDSSAEERPTANRKTYCHDKANKRLFTLEKGDTLPSAESGVETVSKGTYEKLEAEYDGGAGTSGQDDKVDEITFDDMKAKLHKVASDKGSATAKAIISEAGVDKLSAIPEEKWASVIAAADEALGNGDSSDDDDLDL